jgi:hypothetical protein
MPKRIGFNPLLRRALSTDWRMCGSKWQAHFWHRSNLLEDLMTKSSIEAAIQSKID